MNTHKINVKLYLDKGHDIAPETWFKVFNTWISANEGPEVLVDVADYSHVHAGPVTLLVGHECDVSIDDADEKRGLVYNRKKPSAGDFATCLKAAVRAVCETCRRIETDPELGNQVAFRGGDMRIVLNDRLNAPNTDDTLKAIRKDLDVLLNQLYAGSVVGVSRRESPKERFALDIRASGTWRVSDVLKNL